MLIKKKVVLYISFFLGALFLISCRTVKPAAKDVTLLPIDGANFNLLNGVYANIPKEHLPEKKYSSSYDVNALNDVQLVKQFFLLDKDWNVEADKVQLLPLKKELQITALRQDKKVAQFVIKGRLKRGYFKTSKEGKTKIPPIPPFYYFNEKVRLFITINKEKNLVVKRKGKRTGMIFFFGTGFKLDNEFCFLRHSDESQ